MKPTTIGNLTISKSGNIVTVTLNTYHNGYPRTLFTEREIAKVAETLALFGPGAKQKAGDKKTPAVIEIEEEEDWRGLI